MEAWRLGEQVAGFELVDELGRGGMGVVYRARHLATGQLYALKTLSVGADEDARVRFQREGLGQARADGHPNVVRVHTAGEAGGRGYMVLDLLSGGDLAARLKQGPLPPREAARVALEVGRGLAHAHARGVLHRDLKPANVLFDDEGRAKLVDFGLARLAGEGTLTRTGQVLGTPAYMSPEQADGEKGIGPATDVYGLGALLYAALSGVPPFGGSNLAEVLHHVFRTRPVPPSVHAPEVPPALDAICARALEKEPAARYASADELVAALEDYLAGGEDARPIPKGRLVGAALAALALLGVAGAWALTRAAGGEPSATPSPTSSARAPRRGARARPPALEWRLAQGQRLTFDFKWRERNDGGFDSSATGRLACRVEEAGPEGYALRGSYVVDFLTCRNTNTTGFSGGGGAGMFRLDFPAEVLQQGRGQEVFTCRLSPQGAVDRGAGLGPLRASVVRDAPPTPFDDDLGERFAAWLAGKLFEERFVTGLLDACCSLAAPDSPWREVEGGLWRTRPGATTRQQLPIATGLPHKQPAYVLAGEARFAEGRLGKATLEQTSTGREKPEIWTQLELTLTLGE